VCGRKPLLHAWQCVVVNLCFVSAKARSLGLEGHVCEVQIVPRAFAALLVRPPPTHMACTQPSQSHSGWISWRANFHPHPYTFPAWIGGSQSIGKPPAAAAVQDADGHARSLRLRAVRDDLASPPAQPRRRSGGCDSRQSSLPGNLATLAAIRWLRDFCLPSSLSKSGSAVGAATDGGGGELDAEVDAMAEARAGHGVRGEGGSLEAEVMAMAQRVLLHWTRQVCYATARRVCERAPQLRNPGCTSSGEIVRSAADSGGGHRVQQQSVICVCVGGGLLQCEAFPTSFPVTVTHYQRVGVSVIIC
jgi:hypothetical protein